MTSTTMTEPSPSHGRRKALREADQGRAVISVFNTFPIQKYYAAADRLYEAFSVALDERRLDDAYVLGIRFATFCIESLPKHCSYKQKQYATLRLRNAKKVEEVLEKVETVTERMDAEEMVKQRAKRREQEEAQRGQRQEEERQKEEQEEEMRRQMEKMKSARQEMEQSALAKLDAMVKDRMQREEEERKAKDAQKKQEEARKQAQRDMLAAQERKRVAEESEKLVHRDREEDAVRQREEIMPISHQRDYHKPAELRTDEKRTIEMLQETIAKQEERIKVITEVKIPALLCKAKAKLAAGQRKEAMYCVYRKRKWDHHIDGLKAGIFKMETHILRLESAAEDREVAKVMQAATDAMHTIQVDSLSGVDMEDVDHAMSELAIDVAHDMMFDEDELLSELEESASVSQRKQEVSELPGSEDLLSLPSTPSTEVPKAKEPSLLKAVVS